MGIKIALVVLGILIIQMLFVIWEIWQVPSYRSFGELLTAAIMLGLLIVAFIAVGG